MTRTRWIALGVIGALVIVAGLVLAFVNRGDASADAPTATTPSLDASQPMSPPPGETTDQIGEVADSTRPPWEVDVASELDALPRLNGGPLPLTDDPKEFAQAVILYTQQGQWSADWSREEMVTALTEACVPSMPALDEIANETGVTREAMCEWAVEVLVGPEQQWKAATELEMTSLVEIVDASWEIEREVRALDASPEVRAALSRDLNGSHFGGSINVTYWLYQDMLDPQTGEPFDEPFAQEVTTGIMVACPWDESACYLVTALAGGF